MIDVRIDIPTKEILAKADSIPEATEGGLNRVVTAAQGIAERQVGNIRKRRVPTKLEVARYNQLHRVTKSGKKRALRSDDSPAWEPSGDLAESVAAAPVWDDDNTAVSLTADVEYAEDRHDLGVGRIPTNPALGIIRKNPFFDETRDIVESQAADLFIDGFNDVWEKS